MLLLTAANGNQGRLLVPRLLKAGIPFRACTSSCAKIEIRSVRDEQQEK
jgi:uncharacterized protein YbjT (DUF2867 family)